MEWWPVQPDQHHGHFCRPRPAAHSVARRAGAVDIDLDQIERSTSTYDITQGHVLYV